MSLEGGFTLGQLFYALKSDYSDTKDAARSIARLRNALERLGPPIHQVSLVTTRDLDKLVSDMRSEGFSPKTINRYLAVISRSLQWAYEREVILKKPKIPLLQEGPGRLDYLTEVDSERLCGWLLEHGYLRVAVVTQVLLATGFRINELLSRGPKHLASTTGDDGARGYWLVLETGETKNGQPRAAWLSEDLGASLAGLMNAGLPSYREILEGLSRASKGLSLPFKVTPHVLRHTTATRLTAKGVPTAIVKDYMGHRSLATTLRYTHVQRSDLQQAARLLTPGRDVTSGKQEVSSSTTLVTTGRICSPLRSHSATRPHHSLTLDKENDNA
jgi:integrase/recombinase XerC